MAVAVRTENQVIFRVPRRYLLLIIIPKSCTGGKLLALGSRLPIVSCSVTIGGELSARKMQRRGCWCTRNDRQMFVGV